MRRRSLRRQPCKRQRCASCGSPACSCSWCRWTRCCRRLQRRQRMMSTHHQHQVRLIGLRNPVFPLCLPYSRSVIRRDVIQCLAMSRCPPSLDLARLAMAGSDQHASTCLLCRSAPSAVDGAAAASRPHGPAVRPGAAGLPAEPRRRGAPAGVSVQSVADGEKSASTRSVPALQHSHRHLRC